MTTLPGPAPTTSHRTSVALWLVIGILVGAAGAAVVALVVTRDGDSAPVRDATPSPQPTRLSPAAQDARAACDSLARTTDAELRLLALPDVPGDGDAVTTTLYRMTGAQSYADAAAQQDPRYRPLKKHLYAAVVTFEKSEQAARRAQRHYTVARQFCRSQ